MKQHEGDVERTLPRRRLTNGVLIVKKHSQYIAGTVFLTIFFLLLLGLTVIVCRNAFYTDDAILGLKLDNHIVGDFSSENLHVKMNTLLDVRENTTIPVEVTGTDMRSTVTLHELGEHADRQKTYGQLLSAGRSGNVFEQIKGQQVAALGGWNIDLNHPNFNIQKAKKYLESLAKKTNIAATDARFVYENQRMLVRPDSRGRALDISASVEKILGTQPEYGTLVTLPTTQTLPQVNTETMVLLLPVARNLSEQPLTVKAGSSTLDISRDLIAQSLVVTPLPSPILGQKTALPRVSFDKTKLAPLVDSLTKEASIEPIPTLMSGDQVVRPGTPGLAPKDKEPVDRIIQALQSRQSNLPAPLTVEIPMESVPPPVIKNANNDLLARTGTGSVYLTFDDGPGAYTEQILDILKRYNVHATFYVIGRNASNKASTMQRIRDEGHTIGNHSYSHADLSRLNKTQILQELTSTQTAIQQACGVIPTAFRPPYGAINSTVREAAASLGLSVDLWTIDTDDWMQPGTNEIVRRVLGRDRASSVVLLHVLHSQTVDALPAIIEGIRAQGYTLN